MAGQVGVGPERLFLVVGPVKEEPGTEGAGPLVLDVQVGHARDPQVQVELLGHPLARPRRLHELFYRLERDARATVRRAQDEPVFGLLVGLTGRWRFIARPIRVTEQLPVKLGQTTGIGGIEDHLVKDRERAIHFLCHAAIMGTASRSGSDGPRDLPERVGGWFRAGSARFALDFLLEGDEAGGLVGDDSVDAGPEHPSHLPFRSTVQTDTASPAVCMRSTARGSGPRPMTG